MREEKRREEASGLGFRVWCKMRGKELSSGGRYEPCMICPKCKATSRLTQSRSSQNPGRYYFYCPDRTHRFIKWQDQAKPHEIIQVPYCACGAGLCRLQTLSGRIFFTCTLKEGHGSCGFSVCKDGLELMEAPQPEETMTLFQSGMVNCSEVADIVEDGKQWDEGTIHASSPLIDDLDCAHTAMAVEAMINSQQHLKALQEQVTCAADRLFQIEAEVSCCEVEMRQLELQLERVSKNKEALEGRYLVASKELEESTKLLKQKETEQNAAKAAFGRAIVLLRG